jgi:hypothetical protein
LVEDFIAKEIGVKPFQYAVHLPNAALGNINQPHLHLMFSDRNSDDIIRRPEQHFNRFNRLHPELGGCQKYSSGKEKCIFKEELISSRESVARIQNAHH